MMQKPLFRIPTMPTPNLELYIEELVLHGFAARDRDRISTALQQELTRLFTEQGLPPNWTQGGEIAQLNGGTFNVTAGTRPDIIGTQIAQSIYGGFGHEQAASNQR
jgi:hypothetical protein